MIAIMYTNEYEVEFGDLACLERKKLKKEILAYIILMDDEEICKHQVLNGGWRLYSINRFNMILEDMNKTKQQIKIPFIYDDEKSKIVWKLLFMVTSTCKSFDDLPNIPNSLYYKFNDIEIKFMRNMFPDYDWNYIKNFEKYKNKMKAHISNMTADYKQIIDSLENNLQRLSNDNIKKDEQIRKLEKEIDKNEKISKIMSFIDQLKKPIKSKSSKEFFDLFDDFSKKSKKDSSINERFFYLMDEIFNN